MENQHKSICLSNIIYTFTPEMKNIGIGGSSYPLIRANRPPFPILLNG